MSRKDKEKWAKFRREQAKALMVKDPSKPTDQDGPVRNLIGRRRARRYARQNEALAMASSEDSHTNDASPVPTATESAESTETVVSTSPEAGVAPSPNSITDNRGELDRVSTDLARDMERLAKEKQRSDELLKTIEKQSQVVGQTADGISKRAKEFEKVRARSKREAGRPQESSQYEDVSPGLLTKKQADIRTSGVGLVNGRGATNGTGLVNGRGAINGIGLVNGTGMINGTRTGGRSIRGSAKRGGIILRWQFSAILVALAVIIPAFLYLSLSGRSGPVIDGNFSEWAHIAKFDMQGPSSTPELSIEEWAIQYDGKELYLYLQTEGSLLSSSDVDSFFLFVDSDDRSDTGYSVSGIGADYLLELHGWDGNLESSSVSRFGSSDDQYNWSDWISISSLDFALRTDKMEAMANMPMALGDDARFLLMAQNNLPNRVSSVSFAVPAKGGALIVRQEPGAGIASGTGTIQAASSVHLLSLVLSCEGESGSVDSITPVISGATLVAPVSDISLSPGEEKTVGVLVDSSTCQACDFVSVSVTGESVSSTFSDVIILGEGARAYVTSSPNLIQIDGAFGDWLGKSSQDNDILPVADSNIDISATGYAGTSLTASFYVGVDGQICKGAFAPTVKGKPSTSAGGGVFVPVRKTGEDVLRIYIDSDISNSTGQLVTMASKVIGSDYLMEIIGINGRIASQSLSHFTGTEWAEIPASIAAAKDMQQIEMTVPSASIGGSSLIRFIVETTDWRQRSDLAWGGDQPDPLVITSSGDAYASTTGASWDSLGAPALEPGDIVVDATTNPARDIIYAVTNSGRTYQWVVNTSSSWSSNLTDPIASPANVVAIAMYADSGAFILTSDSRPFYNTNLTTTHTWTARAVIPGPDVDFIDLEWRSGNTASTANLYAMRSVQDAEMWFTDDGGTTPFAKVGAKTGKFGPRTQFALIPGPTLNQDRLFVLQESGVIRYSSNRGGAWSTRGDLPVPDVGNSSRYVGISIDASSNIWVITDTGYCFKSTDGAQTFTCVGVTPISGVVGFATPIPITIPEFGLPFAAIAFMSTILVVSISRRRRI